MNGRIAIAALALVGALPCTAQNLGNGELLYRTYCMPCHGLPPLGGAESAAHDPELLKGAIFFRVARMRFLTFLTDAQLHDIAAYIGELRGTRPKPAQDYTDLWWNPDESGWGLALTQHGGERNVMFGVLYTYAGNQRPLWLAMPDGRWTSSIHYTGDLYRAKGPHAAEQPFTPSRVGTTRVGTMTLAFEGSDTARLTYTVDGVAVQKTIRRQRF